MRAGAIKNEHIEELLKDAKKKGYITQEEILKKCLGGVDGISDNGFKQEWRKELQAMDEYAKEMVIGYEIWLDGELNNDSSFNYGKTPEQLYDQYLNHLNTMKDEQQVK